MYYIILFLFFRLTKHQSEIKTYINNEEQLNKNIINLKLKIKNIVRRSKQLTEANNIDNHISSLLTEIKNKEDAYEVEKNLLNTDNQCLKKKVVAMKKDLDNFNSKVSRYT